MTQKQIDKEVAHYKATGKLTTHPHIQCSKTGTLTVMFGSNLANRIHKFGSLANLLTGFECKASRMANKPKKVKAIRKKRVKKEVRIVEMINDIPKLDFKRQEPIVLVDNPEVAARVLTSCYRPDIYLNNDRTCDACSLYNVCKAPCRKLSTTAKRKRLAAV